MVKHARTGVQLVQRLKQNASVDVKELADQVQHIRAGKAFS
jgi:hypothetical protein